VTVNLFMPLLNISNVFRTVEYQPEECLLECTRHCEIPVHSGVRIAAEHDVKEGADEEGIVQMVQSSPRARTRRIARRLRVPHKRVWRILRAEGMNPYHVQRVQHLRPGDFAESLEFCK